MDDDPRQQDLLAEWRTEKAEPRLTLEIDDSTGSFWSLPYAYLLGVKHSVTAVSLFFQRHRVTVTGRALRSLYDAVAKHERGYVAPRPENAEAQDGEEFITEVVVEAVDEWADERRE